MGKGEPGLDILLDRAQSGESDAARAALSDLLLRLYPTLMGYLFSLAGNQDVAEDACQETMARMVASLPSFAPRPGIGVFASLRAWAFTIATNVYRDLARKAARHIQADRRAGREGTLGAPHVPAAEDEALSRIGRDALMAAIDRLGPDQRSVFLLRVYYGYSYAEIGSIVGCPEGTARSRFHYAVLAAREDIGRRGTL